MTLRGDDVPVFGAPPPGVAPIVRPSAYALIADESAERVAVVRTPLGTFLPGGGVNPGESVEDALCRETREECGLVVRLGSWRTRAVEHTWSPQDRVQYEKRSTFADGAVAGRDPAAWCEPDHELAWLPLGEAAECLTSPSQRWALARWADARRAEARRAEARRADARRAGTCAASS